MGGEERGREGERMELERFMERYNTITTHKDDN